MNLLIAKDPNCTSVDIQKKLASVFELNVSLSTIKTNRIKLGWTCRQTGYCQLISRKNRVFRKKWALEMLASRETFTDVIFSDETTVEMNSSGRMTFYQRGSSLSHVPCRAPKPKHSYKVHVWGGISYRGRTNICIFAGIMDSITYQQILQDNLLPFVNEKYPDEYLLYQDNDSKHKSKSTNQWLTESNILTITTPASTPDINPIENVWAGLKQFLICKVKPRTKDALIQGIQAFWETVSPSVCRNYIDHIHKVLPEVVLNDGGATVY